MLRCLNWYRTGLEYQYVVETRYQGSNPWRNVFENYAVVAQLVEHLSWKQADRKVMQVQILSTALNGQLAQLGER